MVYRRIIIALLLFIFMAILAVNISGFYWQEFWANNRSLFLLYDLDNEMNVPTFFSSSIIAINGLLLALTIFKDKSIIKFKKKLIFLNLLLLYVAIDELLCIHEWVMDYIGTKIEFDGIFHFSWVIPAIFIVIGLVLFLYKTIANLPNYFKKAFQFPLIIYITGALGLEMVGGKIMSNYGRIPAYRITTIIEESFEIIGMILMTYYLLGYLILVWSNKRNNV